MSIETTISLKESVDRVAELITAEESSLTPYDKGCLYLLAATTEALCKKSKQYYKKPVQVTIDY